jgi:hypothetical protein
MLAWHGLRPSRARECLRLLLGKHCVAYNYLRASHGTNLNCLCLTVQAHHPWAFDHVRIWLDHDGWYVLTTEPYDATPEQIRKFVVEMALLNIAVTVSDRSPWNPGSTTLLMLTGGR